MDKGQFGELCNSPYFRRSWTNHREAVSLTGNGLEWDHIRDAFLVVSWIVTHWSRVNYGLYLENDRWYLFTSENLITITRVLLHQSPHPSYIQPKWRVEVGLKCQVIHVLLSRPLVMFGACNIVFSDTCCIGTRTYMSGDGIKCSKNIIS